MRTTWVFRPAPRGRPRRVPVGRRGAGGARGWWDKDPGSNKRVRGATWDPRGGGRRGFLYPSFSRNIYATFSRKIQVIGHDKWKRVRCVRKNLSPDTTAFRCVSNYVDAKTSAPFALQHTIHPPLASLHSIQLILKTGSSSNSSSWIFTYDLSFFRARALQLPSAPP